MDRKYSEEISNPSKILVLKISLIILFSIINFQACASSLQLLEAPSGFKISLYAHVPNARQMSLGEHGVVFVGTMKGKVYAVLPNANITQAIQVIELATDLNGPNGVAYHNGALYVAEIDKILKYENINNYLADKRKPIPKVIYSNLLNNAHHGYRYIKFGPDGWLYLSIGMPCNICLPKEASLGTIARMKEDGSQFEVFAEGIRNSMGYAFDPISKELWFTDNGADWLGENKPPDELNFAPKKGMHFGFPFYNATLPDKTYYSYRDPNRQYFPPILPLGPHVAALGMIFYDGAMFPIEYKNQIFIAEHGSWNRLMKSGYRITRVSFKGKLPTSYQPFITGWLQGQKSWGRPVDLLVMTDGSLLISDDYAGNLYRVSYNN